MDPSETPSALEPAEAEIRLRPDTTGAPAAMDRWQAIAEVVLCSGYPTQFAIAGLLRAAGMSPQSAGGSLSAAFVFVLSLVDTAVLLSLVVWLLVRRGERPLTVFFGGRPIGREAGVGAASVPLVIALVMAVTLAIQVLAPALHNVPENPLEGLLGTQAGLLAFLFVAVVAGGLREELQRAFLLHRFRTGLGGAGVGLLFTSVAFGMGHTLQGWDAAIITGLLGAAWGAMYLTRGSAVAAIVSHSVFNSSELLRAFFVN